MPITGGNPLSTETGVLTIVPGDDYYAVDGRSIDFTLTTGPSITGATVALAFRLAGGGANALSIAGTVLTSASLRFEPTTTQTILLAPGAYDYQAQAILSGSSHVTTVEQGAAIVLLNLTTP